MAFINPKRMGTYTLTPAGTSIATDDSNVGQQMLRKMGWSPQSGLGKNGNGAVEPVKASCNYGRKGLGKVPTQFSTGMVQQSVFNTILQSLTKHKSSVGPGKKTKLEDKSKQSQSRVHYGKFVRAKDVSQYSQKSLKIILGGPVGRTQNSPEHGIAPSPPENNWPRDASIKQEFGVKTYSSSTDMASYFSLKRRAVKSDTEGLEARKRARLTPPNDEDKEGKPTFEDQIEATEGHTRRKMTRLCLTLFSLEQSTAFSSSNVHSLSGYPFY
ncbi:unnamed protein product [Hydatigera taeniaeformis]|uniref:G-patch domain-containing protein n=1 Tax=Hydatigena taeniaeformis TaxID=6205 RepID=A0A158RF34_HYDTA|nr:unnamed protein product [Hydatigera taeniaeformis]